MSGFINLLVYLFIYVLVHNFASIIVCIALTKWGVSGTPIAYNMTLEFDSIIVCIALKKWDIPGTPMANNMTLDVESGHCESNSPRRQRPHGGNADEKALAKQRQVFCAHPFSFIIIITIILHYVE